MHKKVSPKRNGEPGRITHLKVIAKEIDLKGKGKTRKPLSLYVVYVKEVNPSEGAKGVEWLLLTDLHVEDFLQARTIIEWSRCRWEIETYFRVIKSGCKVESNRFRNTDRMFNCIAVNMIIGWLYTRLRCSYV